VGVLVGGIGVFEGASVNAIVEVGGTGVFVTGAGEHDPRIRMIMIARAKKY
jgi:hypothetical protein